VNETGTRLRHRLANIGQNRFRLIVVLVKDFFGVAQSLRARLAARVLPYLRAKETTQRVPFRLRAAKTCLTKKIIYVRQNLRQA
jgi:hypothetical protein